MGAIQRYNETELAKPPKDQFDELVSPMFFMVLVGIVPFYASAILSAQLDPNIRIPPRSDGQGAFPHAEILALCGLYATVLPLALSTATLVFNRAKLSRTSLKSVFYTHCYLWTPLLLALSTAGLSRNVKLNRAGGSPMASVVELVFVLAGVAAIVWFLIAEVQALKRQARTRVWIAVLLLVAGLISTAALCLGSIFIISPLVIEGYNLWP